MQIHGVDLHGKAQIIIAKHRKGATGDVLLNFRGEFTRFENIEDSYPMPVREGGEFVESRMNDNFPIPNDEGVNLSERNPQDTPPF